MNSNDSDSDGRSVLDEPIKHLISAMVTVALFHGGALAVASEGSDVTSGIPVNGERTAYFGDLHLVTNYGFAGYLGGSNIDPDAAYRFARGESVSYRGVAVQRSSPALDFMAITDYAENLGLFNTLEDSHSPFAQTEIGRAVSAHDPQVLSRIIDLMLV